MLNGEKACPDFFGASLEVQEMINTSINRTSRDSSFLPMTEFVIVGLELQIAFKPSKNFALSPRRQEGLQPYVMSFPFCKCQFTSLK